MVASHNRSVAVVGAAGYVGQQLCRRLKKDGFDVAGVCKAYSTFLVTRLGVRSLNATNLSGKEKFEQVINLAYPTRGAVYTRRSQNYEIQKLLAQLLAPGGHLIHASTLAVFGMNLERPQNPGPTTVRPDNEYSQSKAEMERSLVRHSRGGSLDIVRLGNIWGPGCPTWTVGLAGRLIRGEPLIPLDADGYSNVTDVANVCDYFVFLLKRQTRETRFHHLAEFSSTRWSRFIEFLSKEMRIEGCAAELPPTNGISRINDLKTALGQIQIKQALRAALETQHLGSQLRGILSCLPEGVIARLKRLRGGASFPLSPSLSSEDSLILSILGCSIEFQSVTEAGWVPPVALDQSFNEVAAWLHCSGYV